MTDAVQGDPPDSRQVLSNEPCLRRHAVMTAAVQWNLIAGRVFGDVLCLRSHAVM